MEKAQLLRSLIRQFSHATFIGLIVGPRPRGDLQWFRLPDNLKIYTTLIINYRTSNSQTLSQNISIDRYGQVAQVR